MKKKETDETDKESLSHKRKVSKKRKETKKTEPKMGMII